MTVLEKLVDLEQRVTELERIVEPVRRPELSFDAHGDIGVRLAINPEIVATVDSHGSMLVWVL